MHLLTCFINNNILENRTSQSQFSTAGLIAVFAHLLLFFFYGYTQKMYSPVIIVSGFLLILLFIIGSFLLARTDKGIVDKVIVPLLLFDLIIILMYGYYLNIGYLVYLPNSLPIHIFSLFTFVTFIIFTYGFIRTVSVNGWRIPFVVLVLFLGLFILMAIALLSVVKDPLSDSFDMLLWGPQFSASGINPYSAMYRSLYPDLVQTIVKITPDYFSFFPHILLAEAPFVVFLKDPRVLLVIAHVVIAIVFYLISRLRGATVLFLILFAYLMQPYLMEVMATGWIEPMLFAVISVSIYLIITGRLRFGSFLLGLVLTSAQYLIILIPATYIFGLRTKGIGLKSFIKGILAGFVLILIFFVAQPTDFVHDTLKHYFTAEAPYYAFSVNGWLNHVYSLTLPIILTVFISVSAILLSLRIKVTQFSQLLLLYAALLFMTFLFTRFAFVNHYYFISCLLLLAILVDRIDPTNRAQVY